MVLMHYWRVQQAVGRVWLSCARLWPGRHSNEVSSATTPLSPHNVATERDGQAAVTVCSCPCHSKIEPSANPSPIPCQNGIKTEPPAPSSLAPSQNGIKTEPPDPSSLAPSQNGIKTTEPPVSGSLAPSQNGTESGSSRPATSSSTSAPLVDGTEKGGGGGTEGERGTGGGGGGRTEGERGTGEGGGGRTEGERGTGRRKTQKVAAATNGEGDSNGVIEVDKDFHRPKKRYRTPGGAASVRIGVSLVLEMTSIYCVSRAARDCV